MKKNSYLLDIEEIRKVLPHRYPFLMIDRILESTVDSCVALKNITINEPYFQGHFPGRAMVPGVLLAEAINQTAAFIGRTEKNNQITQTTSGDDNLSIHRKKYMVTGMNLRFRKPAIPGDQLIISVKIIKILKNMTKCNGKINVGNVIVASGDFNLATIEKD